MENIFANFQNTFYDTTASHYDEVMCDIKMIHKSIQKLAKSRANEKLS